MNKIVSVRLDSAMIMRHGEKRHAANQMIVPQLPSVTSEGVPASNVFIIVNASAFFVIKESANKPGSAA